jgi:hypothetical protein
MHKYLMATAFVVALTTPALAAPFYVGLDLQTKQCHVLAQKPDGTTMKMVGSGAYESQAEAEQAIRSLTECGG